MSTTYVSEGNLATPANMNTWLNSTSNKATAATSITASTTQTQAGGTALTNGINVILTCANDNDAVTLPTGTEGLQCVIVNRGAKILQIFPASGASIDGLADDTSITLAVNGSIHLRAVLDQAGDTIWYTISETLGDTVGTLADDATPSISGASVWKTGGTTTITDFDDGVIGDEITILAAHTVTITHDANIIILRGGGNFAMTSGDTLTLRMFNDQLWHEVSRSDLAPTSAYAPTNVSTDRAYDADSTTVAELGDVLGTLIADLQTLGIID